jgi:D-3-phosphoglycerate dehydrogenase
VRLAPLSAGTIAAAPRLRVIGRHGVGVDNIDVAAATARRIPVVFVPGTNAASVAEHTIGMMLALCKRLLTLDQAVRRGQWQARDTTVGVELAGKTLGVIGLGAIGREVATRCRAALGMRVMGYDPYAPADLPVDVERVTALEPLLREADVVTFHVPLTPETRGMLGPHELSLLKPTALVLNISRGGVIDEAATADALRAGRIAGAAVDVFSPEPPPRTHPLLAAPNTILSPHAAAHTEEALKRMAVALAEGVLAVLRGEQPRHVANPEVYAQRLRAT